jgi:hypothetical protein
MQASSLTVIVGRIVHSRISSTVVGRRPPNLIAGGAPRSYVDGRRDALWLGALLSVSAADATARLIHGQRRDDLDVPREIALEEV